MIRPARAGSAGSRIHPARGPEVFGQIDQKGAGDAVVPGLGNETGLARNPAGLECQFTTLAFVHSSDIDLRSIRPIVSPPIGNEVELSIGHVTRPMRPLAEPSFRAETVVGKFRSVE